MSVHIQTGNMLDVVVEGKSLGLKQRDSDHRKYEVIWLSDPENLAMVLLAELKRFKPAPDITPEPPTELRAAVRELVDDCGNRTGSHEDFRDELIDHVSTFVAERECLYRPPTLTGNQLAIHEYVRRTLLWDWAGLERLSAEEVGDLIQRVTTTIAGRELARDKRAAGICQELVILDPDHEKYIPGNGQPCGWCHGLEKATERIRDKEYHKEFH